MCWLDRTAAFLLLVVLSSSCSPTPEGKGERSGMDRPRLIDLGSTLCTPCKRMAPILERLKRDYAGIVDIEFIDIRKDAAAGMVHAIRVIPTQIFLDRAGREVFRHEGFYSREEIEAILRDSLGVALVPRTEADDSAVPAPGDSAGTEDESDGLLIEGAM